MTEDLTWVDFLDFDLMETTGDEHADDKAQQRAAAVVAAQAAAKRSAVPLPLFDDRR